MTLPAGLFRQPAGRAGPGARPKAAKPAASRALVVLSTCIALSGLLLAVFPPIDITSSDLALQRHNFVFAKISEIVFIREMHKESLKHMPVADCALDRRSTSVRPRPVSILSPHRAIFVLSSFGIGALIHAHSTRGDQGAHRPASTLLMKRREGLQQVAWPRRRRRRCRARPWRIGCRGRASVLRRVFLADGALGVPRGAALAAFLSIDRILVGAHYFSRHCCRLAGRAVRDRLPGAVSSRAPRPIGRSIWRAGEGARRFLYDRRTIIAPLASCESRSNPSNVI